MENIERQCLEIQNKLLRIENNQLIWQLQMMQMLEILKKNTKKK